MKSREMKSRNATSRLSGDSSTTARRASLSAHRLTETTLTRRALLQAAGTGIGGIALASLLSEDLSAANGRPDATTPRAPHFPARTKSIIFLHLVGAPSQLDLFDEKPKLRELDGELLPAGLWKGLRLAFIRKRPRLLASPFRFENRGACGTRISELLPNLGAVVDELAIVRSVHTDQFNHGPAQLMMQTGFGRFGRPSLGAWASYGLGSENRDLPSFVVLITGKVAGGGNSLWGSGFLPSTYQGVEFRSAGDPVLFLSDPRGYRRTDRRDMVDRVRALNEMHRLQMGDPEIATRIDQYEMAFRMQTAVPELMDISGESQGTHQMYGTRPGEECFANHCLLARRLVERGVRFVQLYDSGWDHHNGIRKNLAKKCREVDQPVAALIRDLKQRGLLDETLVVWASEFGRTPMLQGDGQMASAEKVGRDHHKDAFTIWMAGGGVRRGITYGKTDDIGFHVADDPVHIHDLHATILQLMGIDHEQLTFRYQGRDFRLTDIAGQVAWGLLA